MLNLVKDLFERVYLLKTLNTIEVAGAMTFNVGEKFIDGQTIDGIKIVWTGRNFKKLLRIEERNVASATLRIQELRKKSPNEPIIRKLNGTHESFLAYLWEALKRQGSGQKGDLLVNGGANIAYAYGLNLHFKWDLNYCGWYCGAVYPADEPKWSKGSRVLSTLTH